MWDLTLYFAYMSIVLYIFCIEKTTSVIHSSNHYQNFVDGVYFMYFREEELQKDYVVHCDEDILKITDDGKGPDPQRFKFEKSSSDWYHIKCETKSNKCMYVVDGRSVVYPWTMQYSSSLKYIRFDSCQDIDKQLFKFEMTTDGYVIKSKASGSVWDARSKEFVELTPNPSPNMYDETQMFRIIKYEEVINWDPNKNYYIYSIASGLAMDCSTNTDHVHQHTPHGGINQKFSIYKPVPARQGLFAIRCDDTHGSHHCWERTSYDNIRHRKCGYTLTLWDRLSLDQVEQINKEISTAVPEQYFFFVQRPNGIAIIHENNKVLAVPGSSTESGIQLKSEENWDFDDGQLFRITESPITAQTFYTCEMGSSVPTNGIRAEWMQYLPHSQKINRISIPGTHETMGHKPNCWTNGCTSMARTQALNLSQQLDAGIRALDIRLVGFNKPPGASVPGRYFQVRHGENCLIGNCVLGEHYVLSVDLRYSFDDVLDIIESFLTAHSLEFILMRVEREWKHVEDEGKFVSLFDHYYNKKYTKLFWNPPSDHTYIPTVSEVAGKVVVLQGFKYTKYYGLKYKAPNPTDLFYHTEDHDKWIGRQKFTAIKDQLNEANSASSSNNQFYVNYFSSSGGFLPNPLCASCYCIYKANDVEERIKIPTYGANPKAYDYMMHNSKSFIGIIYMDFPGQVLIDQIIKTNPKLSTITFPAKQGILKWITDGINGKLNNTPIRIIFNESALILFAFIVLLIILNVYCVFLYFIKFKAKNNPYNLVSNHDHEQSDIEDLMI